MDLDALRAAVIAPLLAAREQVAREEDLDGIDAALAAEPPLGRRIALEERALDVVLRRLTPPAARAIEELRAAARADGWPSARAMLGALHDLDLGALAAGAEAFLRAGGPPPLGDGILAHADLPRARRGTPPADPQALRALDHRLLIAAFLHDLELLDHGPVPELRERYARRMATASGLQWPSAPWLADADPLLERAQRVRLLVDEPTA